MRRSVALELFPRLDAIREAEQVQGWKVTAFDVELLYLAERVGYRIAEVPVKWADRDLAKGKGKSYVAESQEMARQILRIKINALKGFYDRASNEI
jgi:dolichyl-phosphate beta-glucosyltransferase